MYKVIPTPYISDCDCFLGELTPQGRAVHSAAELFGVNSRLWVEGTEPVNTSLRQVIQQPQPIETLSWITNYGYEALVLVVFLLFCFLLYNSRGCIIIIINLLIGKTSLEKVYTDQTLFFKQYLRLSQVLGALVGAGLLVKVGHYLQLDQMLTLPRAWMVNLLWPGMFLALLAVYAYQRLLVGCIQSITLNHAFFTEHRFLTQTHSAVACLLFTPLFLLFALSVGGEADVFFYIICTLAGGFYANYLLKSCRFFASQDVSIMQWFLYLCAVDFFPITLFLFLCLRSS